ncbi:uncharacterized protein G2W53_007929 [Senna tora]|uniref:Uncharacterized protein n=1 Tax=Senna tora TaxID=362788 RepID=A0A835CHP7_9FABA|nr:uncharacterized protein G2W53_007929 [Senna tora]
MVKKPETQLKMVEKFANVKQ